MNFWNRFILAIGVCTLGWLLGGCSPSGSSSQDEMKEPHYVLGQSRVNAMDYQGAVEAFEQSLDVNPHSAQAHFQLAMLYEQKMSDPAAAIYHYEQYLKYDPNAGNADLIRQRIEACKQQLAANVMMLPSSSSAQEQLQQLTDANRKLQEQLNWWQAQYTNLLNSTRMDSPAAQNHRPPAPAARSDAALADTARAEPARDLHPPVAGGRTHTVTRGETAMAIARKYGLKLSALQAVNPGVNLARIRVGQMLNLPAH